MGANELPDDVSKLAEWILKKYGLDGVMLLAFVGGESGGSTHAEIGLSNAVPADRRQDVIEALSDAAVDLVVDLNEAAQQAAETGLLN